jgi:hypothetical protein
MIRRQEGTSFWLFNQHDHAILAGQLAQKTGNAQFARPDPFESTVLGVGQHDCGWPLHDDAPTLSPRKVPLDVFESPRAITHRVWLASAKRATEQDAYAGLLVSLHVLALSAVSVSTNQPSRFDAQQLRQQFDLNKFQHAVIEHLEGLRSRLGLRVDRPLRLGLAEGWSEPAEELLKFNFRLLQAMDLLSLAICCTVPPANATGPVHARPGSTSAPLQIHRPQRDRLLVKPWPFADASFSVSVPYREIPGRAYASDDELRETLAQAAFQTLTVELRPA